MRKITVSIAGLAARRRTAHRLRRCDGAGAGASADDYCDQLKDAKAQLENFESTDPDFSEMDKALDTMHELADNAPDEVAADWKVVDEGVTTVETALEDAGITMADLGKIQTGQMPEGVDMAKLQELAPKLQSLSDAKFQKATDNIEKHAKDECDVDLSESSSPSQ